jgi:hypothetical protein
VVPWRTDRQPGQIGQERENRTGQDRKRKIPMEESTKELGLGHNITDEPDCLILATISRVAASIVVAVAGGRSVL